MRKKLSLIIILLAALGLIAYFIWQWKKKGAEPYAPETLWAEGGPKEQGGGTPNESEYIYEDPLGRFSFEYPASFTAGSLEERGAGEVVLVQKTDNAAAAFQIFIIPFDEEGPLTPERIKKDIPDMEIRDPQEVVVGTAEFHALIFKSRDQQVGETREVWFAQNGYLYQITAPMAMDKKVAEMMKTWKFLQ